MVKRQSAKELLAASFRDLAQSRPVDKITIQDIVTNCGYSPATFYRNYKDKYDLIAWDYAQVSGRIMEQIGTDGYVWEDTLRDAVLLFQKEKEYLANLFQHTSGQESFVRYMTQINYDALKRQMLSVIGKNELDEKLEMYIRIYCLGTVSLTCEWILGSYNASPEELAEVFRYSLPQPLHPYLLTR